MPEICKARKSRRMIRFFDIADHDRLPWRFYGATRAILARA
ncbi:MAG: hypothetical protein Q7T28_17795 [Cypionkella sp.]|nr:hypothetical protein [Cypionkella sp.]MDO8328782.1 hypothetical protein [Cypionkella sp.]